jgi:release factor glutamine methyltransferase
MTAPEGPNTSDVWTPLKILNWAVPFLKGKGVESPRLDVECLLADVLGCDRLRVYLQYDRPLSDEERLKLRDGVGRRARREPLAYILGKREFFGHVFRVGPGVLIPRPETEMLVESALEVLRSLPPRERTVLDLGTGSGCLALSLALADSEVRVWAVDTSPEALSVAQGNAENLNVSARVHFRQGYWFDALQKADPDGYAVVVSNPPYLTTRDWVQIEPEIAQYEPSTALQGGEDGLDAYRALQVGLASRLTPGGWAFFEMNANLSDKIDGLFSDWPVRKTLLDLQGHPRVLCLQAPSSLDSPTEGV